MVGKVGCLVYMVALLLGYMRGSVLKVDLSGAVKKKGDFIFWTERDAWRVSLCFISLHISDIS